MVKFVIEYEWRYWERCDLLQYRFGCFHYGGMKGAKNRPNRELNTEATIYIAVGSDHRHHKAKKAKKRWPADE